mmetsp:Transcript_105858/g.297644  ORF Transcript_105858/g.297644 Transcript_105858/m.297644 type:complete len:227 (+) Transcript_105858:584-1264(+)
MVDLALLVELLVALLTVSCDGDGDACDGTGRTAITPTSLCCLRDQAPTVDLALLVALLTAPVNENLVLQGWAQVEFAASASVSGTTQTFVTCAAWVEADACSRSRISASIILFLFRKSSWTSSSLDLANATCSLAVTTWSCNSFSRASSVDFHSSTSSCHSPKVNTARSLKLTISLETSPRSTETTSSRRASIKAKTISSTASKIRMWLFGLSFRPIFVERFSAGA